MDIKITTPKGYEQLHDQPIQDAEGFQFYYFQCNDSGKFLVKRQEHLFLNDTSSKANKCVRNWLSQVDFETETFFYVYLGQVKGVSSSNSDYKCFVNHDSKTILIKCVVVGDGQHAGSGLYDREYHAIFTTQKVPNNYILQVERNTD